MRSGCHVPHPAADPAALLDDPACQQSLNQPAWNGRGLAFVVDAVAERCVRDLLDERAACEQSDDRGELTGVHDDLNFFAGARTLCRALQVEVGGRGART